MLTRELAIARYDQGKVIPDRLIRGRHDAYIDYATKMIAIYRNGIGKMRRDLHHQVQALFADEDECPGRRVDAFCKLLDEWSFYDDDRHRQAAKLRIEIFREAAQYHPLVRQVDQWFEHEELAIKEKLATARGLTIWQLEDGLFSDLIEFQRLRRFSTPESPLRLLSRYNVAQLQAAFFDATSVVLLIEGDFKQILRYAKLAGLMHRIHRLNETRYRVELDGPASVLQQTRRYGAMMAKFLPGLLSCTGWKLRAQILPRQFLQPLLLELDDRCGLSSDVESQALFDSQIEMKFAEAWGEEPREDWTLVREGTMLFSGQTVFVPDFSFRHRSGATVLLEIIGFWTPEYLAQKRIVMETFRGAGVLYAVHQGGAECFPGFEQQLIVYKTVLKVEVILERLNLWLQNHQELSVSKPLTANEVVDHSARD